LSLNKHQRAKAIFVELIEQPLAQREPLLKKLCGDDRELEQEVASLLEFHTVRSLMAEKPAPKIRTRPTLSTTRFDKPILQRAVEYVWALTPIFILLFAVAPLLCYAVRKGEEYNKITVAEQLQAGIDLQSKSLQSWFADRANSIEQLTKSARVQTLLEGTLANAESNPQFKIDFSVSHRLRQLIEETLGEQVVYCLLNRDLVSLASAPQGNTENTQSIVGQAFYRNSEVIRAFNGDLTVRFPNSTQSPLPSPFSVSSLAICCPIKNSAGKPVAVLVIQCESFDESLRTLIAGMNAGPSSKETYLVSHAGELLSELRFPQRLQRLNEVLAESSRIASRGVDDRSVASRRILVRDPGVSLLENKLPRQHSANWPLTRAADAVVGHQDGTDVIGYRNYFGEAVVGSWRWLPNQRLGVVLEQSTSEAFVFSRNLSRMLCAIFALSLIGGLIGLVVGRPRRRSRQIRSVGPYQIQQLIGEGGMGKVYLAEHSLLCRPTAVKILSREKTELSVLMRFEREVQLASQLTHPNTIAIYDFGRNEEGVFYYAMEYIDGGHIGQLVEFNGPLPEGRCIYLIRQLCFALREAHLAGVVHRDIKPQNVMVCDRGGEPDFIKLVDYGLVKAFVAGISESTTQTNIIIGTPRFMAPERLQSPWLADPRVDIYSIGGLLYFMVTGELPPLVAPTGSQDSVQLGVETLELQAKAVPFGELLSMCMSYEPASRPSSVASLLHELDLLAERFPWSRDDSEAWWKLRGAKFRQFLAKKREKAVGARSFQ
jgi:eukaryotic-like serine/threonine-protein kinase